MNCSVRRRSAVKPTLRLRRVVYGCVLLLAASYSGAADPSSVEELDDAAARLQYAYYTDDVRALQEVLQLVENMEAGRRTSLKSYWLAYGHWRLAQLEAAGVGRPDHAGSDGSRAARDCARHAESSTSADRRMAEAYAILSVCAGFSSGVSDQPRCRPKPLRTALEIAPDNPRVLLIQAMCDRASEAPDVWRAVVRAFQTAPPHTAGAPDWGHAESLMLLGASCLRRGESLAAREALERALVIAPDFHQAQALLRSADQRSR